MDAQTKTDHYRRAILARYPDLPIDAARLARGGQYNDILRVNDDLIFRFPRFPAGVAKLQTELAILDGIRPFVTLPTPHATYRSFAPPEVGAVFAGYRLLPGEPLLRETVAALDPAATRAVAAQLAAFLRELHAIPHREVIGGPLPLGGDVAATDWRAGWRDLHARIVARVFPEIDAAARARIAAHFLPYLDDDANFAFDLTLIHGDFGTGNILFDREAGAIGGVIDFGSAGLGDPACDLAAMLTYGEPFARQILATYPALAPALPRARFYRGTFAAQEALYGIEHDDPAAFAAGIAPYLDPAGANDG